MRHTGLVTDQPPPPVVHVVCNAEYEHNGPVAAFTDPELAGRHARDLHAEHRCDYEVLEFPLLDRVPVRATLHLHAGAVRRDGAVEGEQSWTVPHWDYDIPAEPVVTMDTRRADVTRIHIAAATPEAARAAFEAAVTQVRELAAWSPVAADGGAS